MKRKTKRKIKYCIIISAIITIALLVEDQIRVYILASIMPVYVLSYASMSSGFFYKRKSIKHIFSYFIFDLKDKYYFKIDDAIADDYLCLTGTIEDYFVSLCLYSKRSRIKDAEYWVQYEITAFGFFNNDEYSKKTIIKRHQPIKLKDDRRFNANDIVPEILWEIDHWEKHNLY